ncbi:MAG: hypothetical protein GX288_02955 [Clostridiales bacterium]|nr:hypothetical protein [Clostridiales bacterium]
MFKEGDYIMYSNYGACLVQEICEKTIDKQSNIYYVLVPINQANSRIMTPVDNKKVSMRALMSLEEAEEILSKFSADSIQLISDRKKREKVYSDMLKEGDPIDLAEIIAALIIEEHNRTEEGKTFPATDKKLLEKAEKLLYSELSVIYNEDYDEIKNKVTDLIKEKV